MGLVNELNRRNVFRVGVAYIVLGWVVIQVTDVVAPALNLPDWTLSIVTWLGIIGFPFALLFAWAFELTPQGLKREHEVDRSQSITAQTGRKVDFAIIALLAIALVFVVVDNYVLVEETEPVPVETAASSAEAATAYDSIAVLPFDNLSSDPEQEYFSDGISEELLNALARLRNLKVAARTSAFAFKGGKTDIREIGRILNVATVLEGSLRKSGNRLRITAQLIDVETGFHLWSETYDRELTDVFEVQDDITAQIMSSLKVHLEAGETNRVTSTTDSRAYEAYLLGRQQLHKRTLDSIEQAQASFQLATSLDPGFALAWAGEALAVYLQGENNYGGLPEETARERSDALIDRALELDPDLAEAHAVRGLNDPDPARQLLALDRAVELNPGIAEFHLWRYLPLDALGRYKESRLSLERAFQLDPLHPAILTNLGGLACTERGTLAEPFLNALAHYPEHQATVLAECHTARGEYALARELVERYAAESKSTTFKQVALSLSSLYLKDCVTPWSFSGVDEVDVFTQAIHCRDDETVLGLYAILSPSRQQNARVQAYLSIVQSRQGKYAEALATLDERHQGAGPTLQFGTGSFVGGAHLYLGRVLALQGLGRDEEADEALKVARQRLDQVKAAGLNRGYHIFDAKIHLLAGDREAGLASLDKAFRNFEVTWRMRRDPVIQTLLSPGELGDLTGWYDDHIDAERAKLGWPPASF